MRVFVNMLRSGSAAKRRQPPRLLNSTESGSQSRTCVQDEDCGLGGKCNLEVDGAPFTSNDFPGPCAVTWSLEGGVVGCCVAGNVSARGMYAVVDTGCEVPTDGSRGTYADRAECLEHAKYGGTLEAGCYPEAFSGRFASKAACLNAYGPAPAAGGKPAGYTGQCARRPGGYATEAECVANLRYTSRDGACVPASARTLYASAVTCALDNLRAEYNREQNMCELSLTGQYANLSECKRENKGAMMLAARELRALKAIKARQEAQEAQAVRQGAQ
jgi:hypothetical protein